jgi:hypothetical protein
MAPHDGGERMRLGRNLIANFFSDWFADIGTRRRAVVRAFRMGKIEPQEDRRRCPLGYAMR